MSTNKSALISKSFIGVLIGLLIVGLVIYNTDNISNVLNPTNPTNVVSSNGLEMNKVYVVKSMEPLDGHIFDVTLLDGRRLAVVINDEIRSVPEARLKMVDYLFSIHRENPNNPLTIVLEKWDNNPKFPYWVASFYVADKELDLVSWLKSNHLIYER